MSCLLDSWDPMAEDYSNPRFNSYNDFSLDYDDCSLYIKNIPSSLSHEAFVALMSEGGRKVIRSKIFDPRGDTTAGLVAFETSNDAAAALSDLNKKPPLNLYITYSKKKDMKNNPKVFNQHASQSQGSFSSHHNPPPQRPTSTVPLNVGRGQSQGLLAPPQRFSSPVPSTLGRGQSQGLLSNPQNPLPNRVSSTVPLNVGRGQSHSLLSIHQNPPPPRPSSPVPSNVGRGQFQGLLSNYQNPPPQGLSSPVPSNVGRGRGQLLEAAKSVFPSLKVVVDGARRTTIIQNSDSDVKEQETPAHIRLPKLVANPFLSCLVCGGVGTYVCDNCKKPYCSEKCQTVNWPQHNPICTSSEFSSKKVEHLKNSRDSSYVSDGSSSDDKDKVPISISSKRFSYIKHATKSPEKFIPVEKHVKLTEIVRSVLPIGGEVQVYVCHIDNPSKFFVHHINAKSVLPNMEKDIFLTQKTPANCTVGVICCTDYKGSMKRVNILKEMCNQNCSVQFIDYGYTSDIPKTKLFNLPEVFKEVPIQAICCKLVEIGDEKNDSWTDDDSDNFRMYTSKQEFFKAKVASFSNGVFEVILNNDEGISLYTIISELKAIRMGNVKMKEESPDTSSSKELVPSVLSSLRNGSEVGLVGICWENDKFWAILDDGNTIQQTEELENELRNLNTKEVNMYAEEGDVVAGFSIEHEQYYRCMLLKRKRDSFLVHFIDYGNKEEISKLKELTPSLLNKCCYIVCCLNPESRKAEDMENIFASKKTVIVQKSNSYVKLLFVHNNVNISLDCYPWNYNTIDNKKEIAEPRIKIEDIPNKSLQKGMKYIVKPVIGNASNLFVQFKQDEKELLDMSTKLNNFCISNEMTSYKPVKNEIVCCKYKDDGYWYRGQVFSKKEKLYTVSFIDFGNNDVLTEEEMKPLPKNLATAKLSACVSLHEIRNEDTQDEELQIKLTNELFDMEIIDQSVSPVQVKLSQEGISLAEFIKSKNRSKSLLNFVKLPNEKSEVIVRYIDIDKHTVYLHHTKDKNVVEKLVNEINATINKMEMVKKAAVDNVYCALCSDGLWYRACIDKQLSPNKYKVTFIDFGNQEDIEIKQLRKLPDELFKIPVYCIPAISQNIKVSQLELEKPYLVEVVDTEKSGVQIIKFHIELKVLLPKMTDLKKQILPMGVISEVKISHLEGDNIFYLQMTSDNHQIETLESKLKHAPDFESLKGLPDTGSLICAKYNTDWFRGSVEATYSDSKSCRICYIDYGNTETVSLENMKILPPEIVLFPVFSFPVQFKNIDIFYEQLHTGASTFSVKPLDVTNEGIQIIEVVLPKKVVSSIDPLLLSDMSVEVLACHQENDLFYVQRVCDHKKLEEIMLNLQGNLTPIAHIPTIGELLLVKYDDGLWYRAQIKSDCGNNEFSVHFVDYGNTGIVNVKEMCHISPPSSTLPMFSVPVKLSNCSSLKIDEKYVIKRISVLDGNIHLVKVRPTVKAVLLNSLKSAMLEDYITSVSIQNSDGKFHYVTKCADSNKLDELINALKDYEGEAVFETPNIGEVYVVKGKDGKWHRGCIKATNNTDLCEVFFIDSGTTENISCSNICYVSEKLISIPILSIKVIFSSPQFQSFSVGEKLNLVLESKTTDPPTVQIFKPHMISSLERQYLPIQTVRKVCVCYIENDIAFVQDVDLSSKLLEIYNELLSFESLRNLFYKPSVGELLAGQSSADNNWYRCCVEEIISCDIYKVQFIDYGNTEELPKDKLRCLSDSLAKFPPFSIATKLKNTNVKLEVDKEYMVIAENKPNPNEVQIIQLYPPSEQTPEVASSVKSAEAVPIDTIKIQPLGENVFKLHQLKYVDFPSGEQTIYCSEVDFSDDVVYIFCCPLVPENLAESIQMNCDITEHCNSSKAVSYKEGETPNDTDMVLAQYQGDWCRAVILPSEDKPNYDVFFIDFGNTETISIDCIRKMEAKFMSLEIQAHLCLLTGVKIEERNKEKVREEIKSNFLNIPITGVYSRTDTDEQVYVNDIIQHLKGKNLIL